MPKHGWIQDPRTSETKRFHPDEKAAQDPRVFVDSGDLFRKPAENACIYGATPLNCSGKAGARGMAGLHPAMG